MASIIETTSGEGARPLQDAVFKDDDDGEGVNALSMPNRYSRKESIPYSFPADARSFFNNPVHRPMEVIYYVQFDVAEHYPSVPVTGCIPGAPENVVLYSESEQETNQQSASVIFSSQWTEAHGVTDSSNWLGVHGGHRDHP
jgi:hypothetical protein